MQHSEENTELLEPIAAGFFLSVQN